MTTRKGRKLKTGQRHPCGKLVQSAPAEKAVPPNPAVIERRRVMLNDPEATPGATVAAENPLDLMLARRWITEADHRAVAAYARLYRAAVPPGPRVTVADLDRIAKGQGADTDGDAAAMRTLRDLWADLRAIPNGAAALQAVVNGEWPQWVVWWINNPPSPRNRVRHPFGVTTDVLGFADARMPGRFALEREALFRAIRAVRRAIEQPAERPAWRWEPAAENRSDGPKVEEVTEYVTEDGEPVLTVVRRRRERA